MKIELIKIYNVYGPRGFLRVGAYNEKQAKRIYKSWYPKTRIKDIIALPAIPDAA